MDCIGNHDRRRYDLFDMYIVANEKRGFIEIGWLIMTDVDKADVKEYEYRRRIIELETEKNLEKQKVMQMKLQYQHLENQCHI